MDSSDRRRLFLQTEGRSSSKSSDVACCPSCRGMPPLFRINIGDNGTLEAPQKSWRGVVAADNGVLRFKKGVPQETFVPSMDSLAVNPRYIVWLHNRDGALDDVVDPCLLNALKTLQPWTITELSLTLTWLFMMVKEEFCRHCVVINGRLCTTVSLHTGDRVGLFNLVDLSFPLSIHRLRNIKVTDEQFLEAASHEEALDVKSFLDMDNWTTRCCVTQPEPPAQQGRIVSHRQWGHLVFLSHAWLGRGNPGTVESLRIMQSAVKRYINTTLNSGPTATVKNVENQDDFGVWLDFAIVPNDIEHNKTCEACRKARRLTISKMMAIPLVATIIARDPDDIRRGWILHELTLNDKQNIVDTDLKELQTGNRPQFEHSHRINLMAERRVTFTNGNDGFALRCHEFLRLGQSPRCWPSVNKHLLEEWRNAQVTDERSPHAKPILFKYARSFHHPCQSMKRAMAVHPQTLARVGFEDYLLPEHDEAFPDEATEEWTHIFLPDTNMAFSASGKDNESWSNDEAEDTPFDLSHVRKAAAHQAEDMIAIGISSERAELSRVLQIQHFVNVTMGLRAELLHGSGTMHWVRLSVNTDALTLSKRSVRLYNGIPDVRPALCSVRLRKEEPGVSETTLATDFLRQGVSEQALFYSMQHLLPELSSSEYDAELFGSGREQDLLDFFGLESAEESWTNLSSSPL